MNSVSTQIRSDADTLSVIKNDLDRNIYVEAGAGTGKTYSLVERIVALLTGGVKIDEVIAITFTRAAASELRSRIRARLEELRISDRENDRIRAALEGIDTAAFQTIDSLVHSLLREHPLESGLPPAIEAQDNFAKMQMFRERWRQWSLEQLEDSTGFSNTLAMAMRQNMTNPFATLNDLAQSINEKHGELRGADFTPPDRSGIRTLAKLGTLIDDAIKHMHRCSDSEDSLYKKFGEVVDWYTSSVKDRVCETEDEADEILATWRGTNASGGRLGNWGGSAGKAAATESLKTVVDAVNEAHAVAREVVTAKIVDYASEFVNSIVDERRRSGSVTYYDAITWLIDMLKRNDGVRTSIQNRYRRVLVDEFQDTDPNQVRLVRLLTIPPDQSEISPGSLFVVGDPKQSIYRFRGAQVSVSQAVKGEIVNDGVGGRHVTLKENRRSTNAIINWVNHVFEEWMRSETGQADWIPLEVAQDTAEPESFGEVFHFGEPMDVKNVDMVRQADAQAVAMIARAVCTGALQVRDRRNGEKRCSGPGDLTILTRARTNWGTYTREFDKLELPYTAEIGGAEVLSTQEFRDLLNCLTAIDDPSDQPATVGALKSTYFGCSDVDLYHWAKAGGRFSCTSDFPNAAEADVVRDAMRELRRFHELRDNMQPPVLIETFLRERQARELMFLENDPAPGLRRLDLAVELTRRFTDEGAASLRECLTRFSQYRESDEPIREQPALEFDEDKIRFMTMHASKGLEFPIVILADLCSAGRRDNPNVLIDWEESSGAMKRIGIRLGGSKQKGYFQTANYDELVENNHAASDLEGTRLHYVSCTRARDYLIVSRNRKSSDANSYAGRIDSYIGTETNLWSPVPMEWASLIFHCGSDSETASSSQPTVFRAEWEAAHRETVTIASTRTWVSPSAIKSTETRSTSETEKPDFNNIFDPEAQVSRGRAATSIGSAVHASIQRALGTPISDIDLIARSEAEKHGVPDRAEEVATLTKRTLAMPLLRAAAKMKSEDIWVETPVAVLLPTATGSTSVLEGVVDLIYRLPDGSLGIADFKTDQSRDRTIEEMAAPYEPQLGAYAFAVQKATGIEVSEASILFSRLAADKPGDGEYRLPNVQASIELALKLASKQ